MTLNGDVRIRPSSHAKVGMTFNRLTCDSVFWKDGATTAYGRFTCKCGKPYEGKLANVINGNTKSCGCLGAEALAARNVKHGMARTKIYDIWSAMMSRCHNPSNKRYRDYGGRGITVTEEWHQFSKFYSDMGERPVGKSLDRMDNSVGYSKENCTWVTSEDQASNKRNNRRLTAFGLTTLITWWGKLIGVSSSSLNSLLKSHHMEDIVMQKIGQEGVDYLCLR